MRAHPDECRLVARAAAGDTAALEQLLLFYSPRLTAQIRGALPTSLRRVIDEEDVLQETFVQAFRSVGGFRTQGPDAFYPWLATIAEHRLLDAMKAHRAAKRGNGRPAVTTASDANGNSVRSLIEQLAGREHEPSRLAADREAAVIVRLAVAGLRDGYREALHLGYLEGLSVAEIASRMGRDARAVHNLCNRGLKCLRERMECAVCFGAMSQHDSGGSRE